MKNFEQATKRDKYFEQLDREIRSLIDPNTGLLSARFSRFIDCPLCSSRSADPIFTKRGYRFVRCNDCGLIYTNPMVQPELLRNAYKTSVADELWIDVLLSDPETSWRTEYFKANMEIIEGHVGVGRLLDIGCSIGQLMEVAGRRSWTTTGLELGAKAFDYATNVRGLSVYQSAIEDVAFPDAPFDAITAFGLLEHVHNPLSVMREVRRLLDPSGVFMAIVPNPYSLLSMCLRDMNVTFDGRNHVVQFSWDALRRLMQESGFEILMQDTILTGLDNLAKYIQYYDPYSPQDCKRYIPESLVPLFGDGDQRKQTEEWILKNNLGLRIRILARPT